MASTKVIIGSKTVRWLLCFFFLTVETWACSDATTIILNEQSAWTNAGYGLAAVFGIFLVGALKTSTLDRKITWGSLIAMCLHPSWTVSSMGGDCGFTKAELSTGLTYVLSVLFCWIVIVKIKQFVIGNE